MDSVLEGVGGAGDSLGVEQSKPRKAGSAKVQQHQNKWKGTLEEKAAQTLGANSPRRIGKQRIEKRSCLSDG